MLGIFHPILYILLHTIVVRGIYECSFARGKKCRHFPQTHNDILMVAQGVQNIRPHSRVQDNFASFIEKVINLWCRPQCSFKCQLMLRRKWMREAVKITKSSRLVSNHGFVLLLTDGMFTWKVALSSNFIEIFSSETLVGHLVVKFHGDIFFQSWQIYRSPFFLFDQLFRL